ncbi:MAG: hypothetical protein ACTSV2_04355 [Candidatus Thorarchaeota archaeon]
MGLKFVAAIWITSFVFAWVMLAMLAAMAELSWSADNTLDFMELTIQSLANVWIISFAFIIRTIAAPCCYCQAKDASSS